jgi:hypothetical protein
LPPNHELKRCPINSSQELNMGRREKASKAAQRAEKRAAVAGGYGRRPW